MFIIYQVSDLLDLQKLDPVDNNLKYNYLNKCKKVSTINLTNNLKINGDISKSYC